MGWLLEMYRRFAIFPVVIVLATMMAIASVFVYYPLTITATPQEPGVVFQAGSNAGQPDIGTDKRITVTLGANATNASITIHPTYQENYYKDVLRIYNGDDNAMNVSIIFTSLNNTLPSGNTVKMFVYDGTTKIKELDITNPTTNTPMNIGQMASGNTWQIDFYVKIPEGTSIDGRSYTASARLVYTPSSETPPASPSSGR